MFVISIVNPVNTVVFGTSIHTHSLLFLSFITIPLFASASTTVEFSGTTPAGFESAAFTFVKFVPVPPPEPPWPPFPEPPVVPFAYWSIVLSYPANFSVSSSFFWFVCSFASVALFYIPLSPLNAAIVTPASIRSTMIVITNAIRVIPLLLFVFIFILSCIFICYPPFLF